MMSASMKRPAHLPDFKSPPLNEVVLGIQFSPVPGYKQIFAAEVWQLYRADFPTVQEQPPLPPTFETFGPAGDKAGLQFSIPFLPMHTRFWFLSMKGEELIQFQVDRLLHNWRKVGDQTNPYPRFEAMIERFEQEAAKLDRYFRDSFRQGISVNQCEVSYINHVNNESIPDKRRLENWLTFLGFKGQEPEDFATAFKFVIRGDGDSPKARLSCDAASAVTSGGQRVVSLTFTYRGNPGGNSVESAIDFLKSGREQIVTRFAELTTEFAHKQWERVA